MSPPSGSWRPLSCFAVFGVFWGTWGALLPAVKATTGASDAQLGLALLALATAALPSMLLSGRLIDRLRDRALVPMATAFGIAVVLPGLAHSPLALGASVVAVGAASGALDVTMNAAVAAEEERRGERLMHAAHAIFSGGVVVAALSVGLARSAGAGPLLVLAVVSGLIVLLALAIHTSSRERSGVERRRETPVRTGRQLLLSIPLLVLGGLCALAYLVENALQSWSALYVEQSFGVSPAISGLGPALFAGAAALGRLGAQGMAARTGDRVLIAGAGILGAIGTAVTAFASSTGAALVGVFVAGAGISVAAPTIFSLAGRIVPPEHRGRAMSTVTTTAYLGFLLGPPLVGTVADALSLRLAFAAVAAVAVLLAILTRYVPRPDSVSRTREARTARHLEAKRLERESGSEGI